MKPEYTLGHPGLASPSADPKAAPYNGVNKACINVAHP